MRSGIEFYDSVPSAATAVATINLLDVCFPEDAWYYVACQHSFRGLDANVNSWLQQNVPGLTPEDPPQEVGITTICLEDPPNGYGLTWWPVGGWQWGSCDSSTCGFQYTRWTDWIPAWWSVGSYDGTHLPIRLEGSVGDHLDGGLSVKTMNID
jgi:hypothetical protein